MANGSRRGLGVMAERSGRFPSERNSARKVVVTQAAHPAWSAGSATRRESASQASRTAIGLLPVHAPEEPPPIEQVDLGDEVRGQPDLLEQRFEGKIRLPSEPGAERGDQIFDRAHEAGGAP